ncbi:transporter substrate-binding domain-containing protein [Temperatibacter marinus]|uniref:Transporter substrate-binding domain-containing protein n=1 Tax=Temperatibacter marinus TaxID=1456591 RepID=A0AA52ED30_9PROT|nr:transporter substrate-binding domain-containing protein [Temperatibacter marinus]WND03227.1 transporter substrate-binding domain-containing protein [Temperatibacter marinus]
MKLYRILGCLTLCVVGCVLWVRALSAAEEGTIIMLYGGHSGYATRVEGKMVGIIPDYIKKITQGTDLRILWIHSGKGSVTLRSKRPNICYSGIYKSPAREKEMHFTKAIGRVAAYKLLSYPQNTALKKHTRLKEILADDVLKVAALKGASYGAYIDALYAKHSVPRVVNTPKRLANLIVNNAVDYVLMADVTAQKILADTQFVGRLEAYTHLEDLNVGTEYYIACSLPTTLKMIERLNQAIQKFPMIDPSKH